MFDMNLKRHSNYCNINELEIEHVVHKHRTMYTISHCLQTKLAEYFHLISLKICKFHKNSLHVFFRNKSAME